MKTVFSLRYLLPSSSFLCLLLAGFLIGCEGEKDDPTGADAYFKEHPYQSEERTDPLLTTMEISPSSAAIGIVGQKVIFTASGGDGNYHWGLSNDNGEITTQGANQCSYNCLKIGNNDVILEDESGHYATAHITPATDTMSVTPAAVSLSSGARYVSFTVSGGTPPYVWTSGNPSLGTISYSESTSYTAAYTAIAGVYGQNTITVKDTEGRVATASVTQSQ